MSTTNFDSYKGIIPPLVTPLNDRESLDIEGLERLIEHILKADVSGLFILGTTGEFCNISTQLREKFIQQVCKLVNGRVKVLIGIADTSIQESINLAQKAHSAGATAVVATPPYYYNSGQTELIYYFTTLARELPLPLFLYNMPVHTKVQIEPATVKAVAESSANVIGLKDSSANMSYFRALQFTMKDRKDFPLFVGPEEITADAVLLGAAGGVNGGANMFPQLYVSMYEASVNRDFARLEVLRNKILEISSLIYTVGKYGSSYLKGLRCALSVLGICDDYLAPPFERFKPRERKIIEENLEKLDMKKFFQEMNIKS